MRNLGNALRLLIALREMRRFEAEWLDKDLRDSKHLTDYREYSQVRRALLYQVATNDLSRFSLRREFRKFMRRYAPARTFHIKFGHGPAVVLDINLTLSTRDLFREEEIADRVFYLQHKRDIHTAMKQGRIIPRQHFNERISRAAGE